MEKKNLKIELEKTLNSLDNIEKAGPNAFFYDRVRLRLENKEPVVVSIAPRRLWQAAACIAALIALNVFVWLRSTGNAESTTADNKDSNPLTQEYFSYLNNTQF